MAEATLGPLMGKLQELAVSEAKALVAVNGDIRGLRDRLMWMQAFLRHADPRRRDTADELMRVWLKQTRDVAFDAEDAIDMYFLKLDLSRYPGWTRSAVRFFTGFTTQVSVRHDLSRKIAEINTRLEDIINNKEKYNIEVGANNSAISQWKPSTIISTVVTNLDDVQPPPIKREEQEKKLEKALHDTKNERVVIFVTGESGVGKTTLVREVYERSTTKSHFEDRVWASFPPYLSSSNILQLIYQQLAENDTWCSRKEVDKKVQGILKNKDFLLVIDGEVSSTDWNAILAALPDEDQGSRGRIIRIMHGKRPSGSVSQLQIELGRFGKAETNDLFKKRVNMEEKVEDQVLTTEVSWNSTKIDEMAVENQLDRKQTDEKLRIADVIHDITRGLPLAVVLLSGLVITKEYPNEWKAVFEHLKSKQSTAKRLDSILTMCFDDLPHDLKSCFLYFAALPVNTPIEARKLVCMWMAEGFLRAKDGKTMEKVGRIYLKELIARNLVKFVKMDNIGGDDEFVAVHHKVHAFLQLEAQESNFVDIHNGDDIPSLTTVRRLSLQNYTDKYAALANSLPKLRSILSNFQEEVEDDVEDEDDEEEEDEDEEEEEEEDEDEEEEEAEEDGEEEQVGRGGSQEEEAEEKEESDGDGEGERDEGQNIVEEGAEDENRENKGDGDNEQQERNEEDKNIEEAVLNDSSEQEKKEMKPGAMPWSGLLRCWGQGANTQDSIKSYIRGMLQQSKFLRVINLQGVEIGDEMPTTIGNAAHLQYLGVTACSLRRIPSTIGKLKNLQTLDVRDTYVEKLPTEFWKIRTLRHVFGSGFFLPNRVGDLKHLQTLETIQPDEKNGWDSKTFERMVHLRSLKIWDPSENSANAKALSAAIEKSDFLQYLEIMALDFDVNIIPMSVFTSPSQRRLRALTLYGELDMLPKDSKFCVPNLTFLSLENTEVSQDFIDKLAKLPLLANLILDTKSYKDYQGQLVFRAGGFKSLIKLTLSDLDLKKLKIGKSALPELTDLVIILDPEDISIEVYGERGFVKKIQDEDEELYGCITEVPIAPKKTGSIKQRVAGGTPQVN